MYRTVRKYRLCSILIFMEISVMVCLYLLIIRNILKVIADLMRQIMVV